MKVIVLPIKLLCFYLFRYEEDGPIGDNNYSQRLSTASCRADNNAKPTIASDATNKRAKTSYAGDNMCIQTLQNND